MASTYIFTVTAANATVGSTYTNNGATFTVDLTITGTTTLTTNGSGAPTSSGTLTKASGTGDATITFSSVAILATSKNQWRRDPAATWLTNNSTLAPGEPGLESDTQLFKFGDGLTSWVNLPYGGITGPVSTNVIENWGDGSDGAYLGASGLTLLTRDMYYSSMAWPAIFTFTVTSANATAGATYTNNGQTFTVQTTIAGGTTLVCNVGTGPPTSSGTLTKATGTGDASITFSAEVTSNNTGTINGGAYKIFVSGILDWTNTPAGALFFNGNNGAASTGTAAGAAGVSAGAAATLGGSNVGGAGIAGIVGVGAQATATGAVAVGNGGGSGTSGAGGGSGSSGGNQAGGSSRLGALITSVLLMRRYAVNLLKGATLISSGAGAPGGGSGAGDSVSVLGRGSGGGGSSAGNIGIYANTIKRNSTGPANVVQVNGGNGGNGGATATGNTGGGGGGSGAGAGWIYVAYAALLGTAQTNMFQAQGGNGGNGSNGAGTGTGGNGGQGGSGGRITLLNVTASTCMETFGSAGTVGGAASGTTGGAGGAGNNTQATL
jgi:hypothetical protein